MAFNYENPHDDPNLGNYDYYVNEVKDFQRKLDEYQESVDQKLADQDADIANLQNQVNGQINGLRNEVRDFEARITDEVDSINEHTETYVNNYLTENITEILETNPVLETKYEKIGYIDTNESVTYNLDTDVIYEVMTIDYALNMHKGIAVNNAFKITSAPFEEVDFVRSVSANDIFIPGEQGTLGYHVSGYPLSSIPGVVYEPSPLITGTSSGNVLTITNNGSNRVRVYIKPIAAL